MDQCFSDADSKDLYLPVDPATDAPVVSDMLGDTQSLLETVRSILALRHQEEDLQAQPNLKVLYMEKGTLPFVYQRGERICAVNPSSKKVSARIDVGDRTALWQVGAGSLAGGLVTLEPQSFIVF